MQNNSYICYMCQQTFTRGWTDEEANAEKLKLWGNIHENECEVVCDGCFQKIKPVSYEELKAKARKDMADVYRKIENHAMRRLLWNTNKEIEKRMINTLLYGYSHPEHWEGIENG